MAQIHKLEFATETKCSANKFYDVVRNHMPQLVKVFPQTYKSIEVLQGDGGSVGSVILWKYFIGGAQFQVAKEKIVAVDDENRSMAFEVIEGDPLSVFKSFMFKVHVGTMGDGGVVKWSLEYEKANNDVASPNAYMDLLTNVTKALDAHLLLKA